MMMVLMMMIDDDDIEIYSDVDDVCYSWRVQLS